MPGQDSVEKLLHEADWICADLWCVQVTDPTGYILNCVLLRLYLILGLPLSGNGIIFYLSFSIHLHSQGIGCSSSRRERELSESCLLQTHWSTLVVVSYLAIFLVRWLEWSAKYLIPSIIDGCSPVCSHLNIYTMIKSVVFNWVRLTVLLSLLSFVFSLCTWSLLRSERSPCLSPSSTATHKARRDLWPHP